MKVLIGMPITRLLIAVMIAALLLPTTAVALNPQPEPPLLPDISVLINGSPLMMGCAANHPEWADSRAVTSDF